MRRTARAAKASAAASDAVGRTAEVNAGRGHAGRGEVAAPTMPDVRQVNEFRSR